MKSLKFSSKTRLCSILLLSLILISQTKAILACKKSILRSFGMTGLEKADKHNALCPGNKNNCCTKLDQMKVHKLWQKHVKSLIINNHKINAAEMEKVKALVKDRDKINFEEAYKEFKKSKNPIKFFQEKFKEQEEKWKKFTKKNLENSMKPMKEALKKFKSNILHMRKGFMCAMCGHNSHLYIDPESNSVTYSTAFCMDLITKNINTLKLKYVDVIGYMVTMHNIVEMLFDTQLFSAVDLKYLETFLPVIESCHAAKDLKTCKPLCQEFNLNKFTNLWDGEKIPIEFFLNEYGKFKDNLESLDKMKKKFVYNKQKWIQLEQEEKKKAEALKKQAEAKSKKKEEKKETKTTPPAKKVLPKVNLSKSDIKSLKDNSFKIQFLPNSITQTLQKTPGPKVAKIEGTDNSIEEYFLFRMVPKPIKFSTLEIKIEQLGLNLHLGAEGNNLETSPEQIIKLIWAKGDEIKPLDEPISDDVRALVDGISIAEISDFVNDESIQFDRLISKRPKKNTLRAKLSILNLTWPDAPKAKAESKGDETANAPADQQANPQTG